MNSPFPVRLRAASVIPRWAIVHSLKQDYVSTHTFFVSVYAKQIASLIDWSGSYAELLWTALIHDFDEVFATGDLVAPVKRNIIDAKHASDFISRKMIELAPGIKQPIEPVDPDIKLIIKAADQLDALLYAIGEQVLGNGIIAARIPSCEEKLMKAWFKLPCTDTETTYNSAWSEDRIPMKLATLWLDVVWPAIDEHRDPLRYDIGK